MCEVYGFCGSHQVSLNKYTNEFWLHSKIHQDGFGYYLADKDQLYVNQNSAMNYIKGLNKFKFNSKLALCHIRFKTHGPASKDNCHPFIKTDIHGVKWSLIHNGYIEDSPAVSALGTLQKGETDSERILLCIVETVNSLYEHSYFTNTDEFLNTLYSKIEKLLSDLSSLGKTNLVFTDSLTNNMYVYMNHRNTLFFLNADGGVHVSTTPLSRDKWVPVEPNKLHIFNNGKRVNY